MAYFTWHIANEAVVAHDNLSKRGISLCQDVVYVELMLRQLVIFFCVALSLTSRGRFLLVLEASHGQSLIDC